MAEGKPIGSELVLRGLVKQVNSGDSVVIRGQPVNGPPPERTVCLAGVTAPRLGRRGGKNSSETKDEAFAWQSREYLRNKVLGKEIKFVVSYSVPSSGRQFGLLYIGNECVNTSAVAAGWLKVREDKQKSDENAELLEAESQSREAGLGLWTSDETAKEASVRKVIWDVENPRKLVNDMNGKPISAIIEQIREGSFMRCILLPSFQCISIMLSGVKCPGSRRSEDSSDAWEPFGLEAKFFVESRLLQREVNIVLEGVSSNNTILATVQHPAGNISEALLANGLARIVDWSMASVSSGRDRYRATEKAAKEQKLRIWKEFSSSAPVVLESEFQGKVIEIVGVETLMIKTSKNVNRKINISSIRGPKIVRGSNGDDGSSRSTRNPVFDTPYLYEAKEFMRKKLIGKKVTVTIDYVKAADGDYAEKTCATVVADGVNIAEALVSKGYATVLRHRGDDDQRSSRFDDLLVAESRAQKNGKGLHGKGTGPTHRVSDLSTDSSKAKAMFPFLERAGKTPAIVEYVASGSRVKVYIPKETCVFSLLLGGIVCPRTGMKGSAGEPFADEATLFTKERLLQRDVEVSVEGQDKNGNMIGAVYIDHRNHAVDMVAAGLAKAHFTADRLSYGSQLTRAEVEPKANRIKVWENYVEKTEESVEMTEVAAAIEEVERKVHYSDIAVTEIRQDGTFFIQKVSDLPALDVIMSGLWSAFNEVPPVVGSYTPKVGDQCASKFIDDQWYRAKVLKVAKGGGNAEVFYVDFGNIETVPLARLAVLPIEFTSEAPKATEVSLAGVRLPDENSEWHVEALDYFNKLALNVQLKCNVETSNRDGKYVTLLKDDMDIGRTLIMEGLAVVDRRREKKLSSLMADYTAAQNEARDGRRCLWEYGDFAVEEAREFGFTKA